MRRSTVLSWTVGAAFVWFVVAAYLRSPVAVLGAPAAVIGCALGLHAVYRLRHPEWRTRGWWAQHRWLAAVTTGTSFVRSRWIDRYGAVIEFVVGLAFFGVGVAFLASA
jgi:hypothetical protein